MVYSNMLSKRTPFSIDDLISRSDDVIKRSRSRSPVKTSPLSRDRRSPPMTSPPHRFTRTPDSDDEYCSRSERHELSSQASRPRSRSRSPEAPRTSPPAGGIHTHGTHLPMPHHLAHLHPMMTGHHQLPGLRGRHDFLMRPEMAAMLNPAAAVAALQLQQAHAASNSAAAAAASHQRLLSQQGRLPPNPAMTSRASPPSSVTPPTPASPPVLPPPSAMMHPALRHNAGLPLPLGNLHGALPPAKELFNLYHLQMQAPPFMARFPGEN